MTHQPFPLVVHDELGTPRMAAAPRLPSPPRPPREPPVLGTPPAWATRIVKFAAWLLVTGSGALWLMGTVAYSAVLYLQGWRYRSVFGEYPYWFDAEDRQVLGVMFWGGITLFATLWPLIHRALGRWLRWRPGVYWPVAGVLTLAPPLWLVLGSLS